MSELQPSGSWKAAFFDNDIGGVEAFINSCKPSDKTGITGFMIDSGEPMADYRVFIACRQDNAKEWDVSWEPYDKGSGVAKWAKLGGQLIGYHMNNDRSDSILVVIEK
ncbi:MAG: hypothetical protein H7833_16835 [Magnetococcus sp. DMHC-1]